MKGSIKISKTVSDTDTERNTLARTRMVPIPSYEIVRDTIYEFKTYGVPLVCVLKAGERCYYFEHADAYLFDAYKNLIPYYKREVIESLPEFFRAVK